jgi:hypothetical protein
MDKTVEIVICTSCKGTGKIFTDVLVDYHKREYDTIVEKCERCNGSGRLQKITTVVYEVLKE